MLFQAIDRPSVQEKILDGVSRKIAKLHSPPAFGKTAALRAAYEHVTTNPGGMAELFPQGISHCGWLTFSHSYADAAHAVTDLATALGVAPLPGKMTLPELFDEVGCRSGCTLLFLDEVEEPSEPGVASMLSELFLNAPDNLRIASAFRHLPHLPLARLGVRGLVTELTARELAFSRSELRTLFGRLANANEMETFYRASYGWPALAQITRDLLPGISDPSERRSLFDGNHPRLHAYVSEELAALVSPSLHAILRYCAILDDFSPELAEHLSGLKMLPAEIRALDDLYPLIEKSALGPGWYCLHPVLRRCLEAELAVDPNLLPARLHSKAAVWFTERQLIQKAVSHAAQGGNFSLAADAIRQAGGVNLFIRAGHTVLQTLIEDLPASVIHESPGLMLCHTLVLAKSGNVQAARERIEALKMMPGQCELEGFDINSSAFGHIEGMIGIYQDLCSVPAAVRELERMAAELPPQATWDLGWINNHLCIAYTRTGRLDLAHRTALKGLACYREEKAVYAEAFMLMHLGLVNSLAGNFSAALSFCRQAQELARSAEWKDENLDAICSVAAAEIHYQRGDLRQVEESLNEAMKPIVRGEGWVEIFVRLFWNLARSRLRLSGLDLALAAIDKAEEVAVERSLPRLKHASNIMRVELFTRSGLIESAVAIADRLTGMVQEAAALDHWTWRETNDFHLARARLHVAQGNYAEAMENINLVLATSHGNGSGHYLLAAEVLAVRVTWEDGAYGRSLEFLQSAIARARVHEVTQMFVDEGPEFAAILRAIVRRFGLKVFSADGVDFISRVVGQRALLPGERSPKTRNGKAPSAQGLLSAREREALLLLRKGKSNKEIARDLGLSEATIKFHMKNVFLKLGVNRRSMAIAVSDKLKIN
ncbi:transcriptional regulator [Pseudaminobacter sp. 19-2017]|uniref:Transcriptional regulator n=2 Tax=Pseudaminobacter soli (ex Zhang et al. 2022) TaxID=2831468 RepID=A0A942E263_9HYPH|nr:transcriptional regulator [Pseudaminobacter soli]